MPIGVTSAILLLWAVLWSAPAEAQDAVFVDIGCMFPMTGRGSLYGRDSVAAIEMAVEEVNAAGGVAGFKLRTHLADSQSKPAFAVSIARRFIADTKVHFLCGVVSSSVGLAVSEVALEIPEDLHRHRPRLVAPHHRERASLLFPRFQQRLSVDGRRRALAGQSARNTQLADHRLHRTGL